MYYSVVFILAYQENNYPIRIKQLFRILFFSPWILKELNKYNNIPYTYISSHIKWRNKLFKVLGSNKFHVAIWMFQYPGSVPSWNVVLEVLGGVDNYRTNIKYAIAQAASSPPTNISHWDTSDIISVINTTICVTNYMYSCIFIIILYCFRFIPQFQF